MGNWVHAIIRALDAQGVAGAEVAREAGVPAEAILNPEIRVPQPAVTQLWHLAVDATGDPCFGLVVPRHVTPNTFGALTFSLFASPTLEAALKRIVRYHGFVTSGALPRFEGDTDQVRFVIPVDEDHHPADASIDAFALLIVRMARFLTGEWHVQPEAVRLRRAAPREAERFAEKFRCRVHFGAPENRLEYSRTDAGRPLPDANATIAHQNDEIMARQLEALDQATVAARVRQELLRSLPDGPTEATVASQLGLSKRHLHRLLGEEGTTYRALLRESRVELACSYLREGRYAIKEIAFLLGFADSTTFSRAFKRWTGNTPGNYPSGGA